MTAPSDLPMFAEIPMREYAIGSGAVTFPANREHVDGTFTSCVIIAEHWIWNDNLQSWQDMTAATYTWLQADPADGAFIVN